MKFNVTLDCTPAEARAFLGLPDVTPLQEAWLGKAQQMMVEGMSPTDLERLTRAWTSPMAAENLARIQQMFWQAAGMPAKP
jgi:hypothetical protein